MKILLVHNRYLLPGGEDEVVKSEAALLRAAGHDVVLYERSNDEAERLSIIEKVLWMFKDSRWSSRTYRAVRALIASERPDLVHIHNTFFVISPSVYDACYDAGVPVVQTLHNYRFLCPVATFYQHGKICEECLTHGRRSIVRNKCFKDSRSASWALKGIVDEFYRRRTLDKVSRFIALSRFSLSKFIANGFDAGRFSVKPNFIDIPATDKQMPGAFVLYVGALRDYKGITTLLKAWENAEAKVSLKIIGDGPLKDQLKRNYSRPDVEFLGHQPFAEILTHMQQALFLVVPSECYENFPRVIAEAYGCSLPVVASRLGALEELVEEGKTGLLFKAFDEKDCAAQMRRLLDDPNLAFEMGRQARRIYETRYTSAQNYTQLMAVYQEALKKT